MELMRGFSHIFPSWLQWLCNPPLWLVNDYKTAISVYQNMGLDPAVEIPRIFGIIPFCINVPAILLFACYNNSSCSRELKESTKAAATILVFIKACGHILFVLQACFM